MTHFIIVLTSGYYITHSMSPLFHCQVNVSDILCYLMMS